MQINTTITHKNQMWKYCRFLLIEIELHDYLFSTLQITKSRRIIWCRTEHEFSTQKWANFAWKPHLIKVLFVIIYGLRFIAIHRALTISFWRNIRKNNIRKTQFNLGSTHPCHNTPTSHFLWLRTRAYSSVDATLKIFDLELANYSDKNAGKTAHFLTINCTKTLTNRTNSVNDNSSHTDEVRWLP